MTIYSLLFRFKEREENVKADIFHAYQALLRQTKPSTSASINVNLAHDNNRMEAEEGPVTQLQAQVPACGGDSGVNVVTCVRCPAS